LLEFALFNVWNKFNPIIGHDFSSQQFLGNLIATGRLLIAVRLARFLHPFMAWCIFNKRQAHSYIHSTWTLQIILVYLILNFSRKHTDFKGHYKRTFLLCNGRAQADSQKASR